MDDRDCGRVFALLSEYLDRELPAATCRELEEHFADCPECIQFVQSLKRSVALCRQFGRCQQPSSIGAMADLRRAYEDMLARRRSSEVHNSQT